MIYPSGECLDQSIDSEKFPSILGNAITGSASEPFQIVPYTTGVAADDDPATVVAGDLWKRRSKDSVDGKIIVQIRKRRP